MAMKLRRVLDTEGAGISSTVEKTSGTHPNETKSLFSSRSFKHSNKEAMKLCTCNGWSLTVGGVGRTKLSNNETYSSIPVGLCLTKRTDRNPETIDSSNITVNFAIQ